MKKAQDTITMHIIYP